MKDRPKPHVALYSQMSSVHKHPCLVQTFSMTSTDHRGVKRMIEWPLTREALLKGACILIRSAASTAACCG